MSDELDGLLSEIPDQAENYAKLSRLIIKDDFTGARELLKDITLPESTKIQLGNALYSNDPFVIKQTFHELSMRVAQAMCWGCWGE